jgi:hypothetical protein
MRWDLIDYDGGWGKKENKTLLPQARGLVQSVGLDEVSAWVGSIKLAGCIVYLGCTQVHYIYIFHPRAHPSAPHPTLSPACLFFWSRVFSPPARPRPVAGPFSRRTSPFEVVPVTFSPEMLWNIFSFRTRKRDGGCLLRKKLYKPIPCGRSSPTHPGHQLCTATSQD